MTFRRPSAAGWSRGDGLFECREGDAGVAARPAREFVDQLGVDARVRCCQAALGVGEGAVQDRGEVFGGERIRDDDAAARKQGGVDLERRVFGGGADQGDGAVFDGPEQCVLLGLVEAMDLVDEENGSPPAASGSCGRLRWRRERLSLPRERPRVR